MKKRPLFKADANALRCLSAACVLLFFTVFITQAADTGGKILPGHVPPIVSALNPIGQPSPTNQLYLAIGLPLRDQVGLNELLHQLYDPASTNFHKYLSPTQIADRFGPSEADYQAVKEYVAANGLVVVNTHSNRMVLDVAGRVTDVEHAFGVTLHTYHHPAENRDFFAPDTEPVVPAALSMADIQGLSDFGRPHPTCHVRPSPAQSRTAKPASGSGPGGEFIGNDFRVAYVPGSPLTGSNQIVGLVQFDGFYSNDITSYESQAGLPVVPLQTVLLDSYDGTPGSANDEVSLDIEMVISMAPGISNLIVYEGNPNSFIPNDVLSRIQTDNLAKQISSSWTWNGGPNATTDNLIATMAAQGQSYFNASGDSDAYTGANILDSASNYTTPVASPYVIAVGGTELSTGSGGAWTGESVWNWNNSGRPNFGSSGGISSHYTIPGWQTNAGTAGGRSTIDRNVPDVALAADNIYVVYGNGSSGDFGGTSCASPLWAGFAALMNQQAAIAAKPAVGFINPAIYALAAGTNYNNVFHDVTTGDNIGTNTPGLYSAATNYDLCTGLGTPNGTNFINALVPVIFAPSITNAGWALLAESAVPTNGAIDPGETVTVNFTLKNQGNLATSNLVATLLPGGSILAPSAPQSYGSLPGFGGATTAPFTFTAAGGCGSTIVATFQLQDGANNLGSVNFNLPLGKHLVIQSFAQNFDSGVAPALPSGWVSANLSGTASNWITTSSAYDTAPDSAFLPDLSNATSENALVSPVISIVSPNAQLAFRHNFSFDVAPGKHPNRDGGVLEIQMGNGGFNDILSAGGSFVTNGYNGSISTSSNPLGTRSAWVASSGGWQTVVVSLPASAAGQNIQLRWNCGTLSTSGGSGGAGWNVDSISVTDSVPSCLSVFTDVATGQSLDPNSLQVGQNLLYTLAVTNLGPQSAANVIVTDTVPANATVVSAPGGTYSNGQVVFPAGMLPVNAATNFTLTLAPTAGYVFTNLATAATVTPEFGVTNSSATLVVTQISTTVPIIVVSPSAQTVQCGGNASFSTAASGASPLSYQWSLDGATVPAATNTSFSLTNIHLPSHTVAFVVTNSFGSVTSSVPLTVQDTLPPAITLNGANPLYLQSGNAYVEPGATASDLCVGAVPVTISGMVNTNAPSTNFVTYSATDGNGNTGAITRTVIVQDTTPPTITWSFTNLVLAANSNCVAPMPNVTGTNYIIATDGPDSLTITQVPTNNAALPLGTNVIVLTAADPYGNKSFSTNRIVVLDTTPPAIVLRGFNPMTNELGTPFADPGATAGDTCSGLALFATNGTVNINVIGTNTLTYIAVDGAGNTNTAIRTVFVYDTAPPTIVWSFTNLFLNADSNCMAVMPDVTGTNFFQATDLSGVATISQSPTNGAFLPPGTNTVVIAAADPYGNTAYSTNQVIVQDQLPNITLNGAGVITNQLGVAFIDPGITASETCSGIARLSTNGAVNVNVVGTNILAYTAVDGAGVSNTAMRTVIVLDTVPPAILWSFTNLVLAANSNCVAPMPNVTGTNYIIVSDGPDTLSLTQSPANGASLSFGTNLVVITVSDLYSNTVYSTNQIIVQDQTPPVLVLNGPNPMTNGFGDSFTDPGVTASDACSGIALLLTNGTVNINAIGTNLLTYIAVDGSGNTNTVTRTVYVYDTTPPSIIWNFTNLVLAANSNCLAPMPDITGTNYVIATDLFGVAAISQTPTNNYPLSIGTNIIVVAATDIYSNTAFATNLIIVEDQTPPILALNGYSPMTNELGDSFTDPGVTASDACSGIALLLTNGTVNVNAIGANLLTYIAMDGSGNTNIATRTVFVCDTTPPSITWNFTNLVLAANSNCVAPMPDITGTNYVIATDLSGVAAISQSPTNNYPFSIGTNIVVIAATDIYSNTAFATNLIIVQDQTPPQILVQPQSQTNNAGATAAFSVAATACTPLAFQWLYNNSTLIAQTNNTLVLSNLDFSAAGNYLVVVSANGGSATSALATLTVFVPPGINGVTANPDGSISLTLTGASSSTYILESTTNLSPAVIWLPLATNTLDTNGLWQFTDLQATNFPQQFYRLMLSH